MSIELAAQLLSGVRVVDLAVGMPTALVARFLNDAGASITRILPPNGDPFGEIYPAYDVWHGGAVQASADQLERLLAEADICLVGGEDHPDVPRRTDAAAISARHPRLVVLDVTGYPAGYQLAGRPATDVLVQAASGLAWEQFPDRPIIMGFEPCLYGAALHGLAGLMAALYERESSGKGQSVTTSLFAGALIWVGIYWMAIEKPTPMISYTIPRGVSPLVFRCSDGVFVHIVIGGAGSKYGMYKALGIDDPTILPTDSGMPKPGGSPKDFFGDYDLLAKHVAMRPSAEILASIWAQGLPAEPVLDPGACWDDPQIVRNDVIKTDPDGTRRVGIPFKISASSDAVAATSGARQAGIGVRPLDGVRVVDCGAFVAGPFASVILADLGADVIKVEAKAGDPNRSLFKGFSVANRGKKGLAVDMKSPDGRAIVQTLCAGADIVCNNFRPGVSARLGVDPASLHKLRPDLIVLESPAYGSEGPLALKSGFDMVMQAWCGHEAKAAGLGNDPLWSRTNLVDFGAGMIGAVAMLAALYHRARTGQGAAIESPLVNAGIYMLSELVQRPGGQFEGVQPLTSDLHGYRPSEALYQAKDGWVAIVARGNAAALRLRRVLGLETKLGDDVASWGASAEAAIAAAVADRSSADLAALLEPERIWVEPSRQNRENVILSDPGLAASGLVRVTAHAKYGELREFGAFMEFSRSKTGNTRVAPALGESTDEILAEYGYSEPQMAAFKAQGVTM